MKICCMCKNIKEEVHFCKNKNSKDGLSAQCRECAKLYRDLHKQDEINYSSYNKQYWNHYREDNKDIINERQKKDYENNPQKYQEQQKKSHQNHREERLIKQHAYYEDNKEYFAEKNKKYRNEHIDEILLRNRQREKLLDSFPIIKQSEINNLLDTHNHRCFYCLIEVKRGINLHLDHKTPLARGGAHSTDNLVPACRNCNLRKGTQTVEEFLSRKR